MPTSKPRRVRTRRTFSKEFKLQILRELDAGSTIAELALRSVPLQSSQNTLRARGTRTFKSM